jgi:hypothetical protein
MVAREMCSPSQKVLSFHQDVMAITFRRIPARHWVEGIFDEWTAYAEGRHR